MLKQLSHPLLQVKNLEKTFQLGKKTVSIVNHVSFDLAPGEILGIGGESGCGKSTLGKTILQLLTPSSGSVLLNGVELTELSPARMRIQRRHMQMIFQNPADSFNPRFTVKDILSEPFKIHGSDQAGKEGKSIDLLLEQVGLGSDFLKRYPHELSGGQKQRVAIARALALKPRLIICDEPFSALDASIQLQIMQLLKQFQQQLNLAYILISHDLSAMRHFTQRLAIMYLGEIVEIGPSQQVYEHALHPYTQALISAIPVPDPQVERLRKPIVLKGELPSLLHKTVGCPFQMRCPYATEVCRKVKPSLQEIGPKHFVACHLK